MAFVLCTVHCVHRTAETAPIIGVLNICFLLFSDDVLKDEIWNSDSKTFYGAQQWTSNWLGFNPFNNFFSFVCFGFCFCSLHARCLPFTMLHVVIIYLQGVVNSERAMCSENGHKCKTHIQRRIHVCMNSWTFMNANNELSLKFSFSLFFFFFSFCVTDFQRAKKQTENDL